MDVDSVDRVARPPSSYEAEDPNVAMREEDKEEEGTVENREMGLGTVVVG